MPDREAKRRWGQIMFELAEARGDVLHPADLEGSLRQRIRAAIEARDEAIRRMAADGFDVTMIARASGETAAVVRGRLKRMGLRPVREGT